LSKALPEYMIPSYFVRLEKLLLTSNGKIDRKALPEPEMQIGNDYTPPRNEIERKILEIWSDVLKVKKDRISVSVNFFEIGGNSISLLKVNHEIKETFKIELPVAIMFRIQNISAIADYIMNGDNKIKEIEEGLKEREEALKLIDNER
jgi:acyl carrier protein